VQDLIRLLKDLRGTIQRFNELEYGLFRNWARRILAGKLPRTSREMLLQMIDEEEVDRMITNIERVIDKALADKYRQGKQVGLAEGKKAGLAEGKKAGFAEGKRIIACKLLQKGLSPAEVSELTELPLDQVKGLMRPDQGL
jgi:predicted transposase YdaD